MALTYSGLDVNGDQGGLFPWKSKTIDVGGGVKMRYVDEGPRNAPLTFLLCHGNPTWGFLYRRFIEGLSKQYRVVVPDHVGFGRSDKPRDPDYYSLERHVGNLEALVRKLDLRNVVPVVQDWGGPIGMGVATRHPERIAGLVILNTWAFADGDGAITPPWLFRWLVMGKGGKRRTMGKNFFTEFFVIKRAGRKLSPEEADAYRAPHPTPDDRVGVSRFAPMIPPAGATTHESYATMKGIEDGLAGLAEKPALIIWAMRDLAFRKPQLERWQKTFRHVDGPHLLPNAKHYLQEDAPEEIVPRIDVWADQVLLPPTKKKNASTPKKKAAKK